MSAQTTALTAFAARVNSNSLTSNDQAVLLAALAIVIDNWVDAPTSSTVTGIPGGIPPVSSDAWFSALIPIAQGID